MKTKFLAIWHDRHTDDKYVVFDSPPKAIERCRQWMNMYPKGRYTFVEQEIYPGSKIKFYADAGEDYAVSVEEVEYRER